MTRVQTALHASPLRIGLVVPHIFMHRDILPQVIFSPGQLALQLAHGLQKLGAEVTLFTPGPVDTTVRNVTADLSYFEAELAGRGDSYLDLLKKHPFTFITLARQVQGELVAQAYAMAQDGNLDIVHVYTNEEDIALPFAQFCSRPVVFTHHDPFNFLVKYKSVFPKYRHLNWLSMSLAQRRGMPDDTNWIGNIYHGLDDQLYRPVHRPRNDYVLCLGRIIKQKGVHLAIAAIRQYNRLHPGQPLKLKIAGKHYSGHKDTYWRQHIEPQIDGQLVEYVGFVDDDSSKRQLLAHARAVLVPSTFEEPFGMVMIEALACGTPVIGLGAGAIPEVVKDRVSGFVVDNPGDEAVTIKNLVSAIGNIAAIDRQACRRDFEDRFTIGRMCRDHLQAYGKLTK